MRAELQRDIYQLRSVLARIRDLLNTPPTSELGDPNIEAAWRLAVEYAEEGNHEVLEKLRQEWITAERTSNKGTLQPPR